MTDLTAVSLFAGVGGIDLALERAGVTVTAAVEKDAAARGVIADRLPETHLFNDVTEVTADELRATGFVPERGILTAGWPCQGNSVAGRRGGLADPRSGLWRHVVRLLADLRPRWFLGENVPGLLSVTDGEDFGIVLDDLADLGMGFAYRVMDAQFTGVPQRRRRVFLVGHLGGTGAAPVQVLFEPEGRGGDRAPIRRPGARVAATLTSGAHGAGVSAPGRRQEDDVNLVVSTLQRGGQRGYRVDAESAAGGHLIPVTFQKVVRSGGDNTSESRATELVVQPMCVTGNRTHALTSEGADASEDGTGRGTPLVTTEVGVRRLTPLECERLQGFPDNWTATSNGKPQADSARYRQMGNAVAVPCVEWIARRIVAADKNEEVAA